jgi:hypothetical protein
VLHRRPIPASALPAVSSTLSSHAETEPQTGRARPDKNRPRPALGRPSVEDLLRRRGRPRCISVCSYDLYRSGKRSRRKAPQDRGGVDGELPRKGEARRNSRCVCALPSRLHDNLSLTFDFSFATGNQAARLVPAAPPPARHALLSALRNAHATLLTPPPIVASDPVRLARWKPRVRRTVDWESVVEEGGETGVHAGEEGAAAERRTRRAKGKGRMRGEGEEEAFEARRPPPEEEGEEDLPADENGEDAENVGADEDGTDPHPYLTVGLIGEHFDETRAHSTLTKARGIDRSTERR